MTRMKYVFTVLIIIIALLIAQIAWIEHNISMEGCERQINESWDDGWWIGYEWGAYDIFEEVIRNGVYVFNETWILYSPVGCLVAIQNEGCEVVCVGP